MDIPIHVLNGLLRQAYWLGDHWPVLVCGLCGAVHVYASPTGRGPWFIGFGVVTAGAAGLAGALDSAALRPLPLILAGLAVVVVFFVALDRHQPEALRWRTAGGLAVYGLLVFMFAGFDHHLQTMEAAAVAELLAGQGDADAMVRTGRYTLRTIAAWAMWLMGPLGIVGMLGQGVITHLAQTETPEDRMRHIRRPRPRSLNPPARPPLPPPGHPSHPARGHGRQRV